jgi:class 3 adenylate cyclase
MPVAERRLVSVLFADLVGFTTFSEAHDAEDVQEMQGRYFTTATQIVTRHGGTIEKFIGDAVMAVWGTPIAREDDAERAVRAGLELVAAVPDLAPGISARCGVLTGEAAVTLGATNQGMVTGDIVNTAARLQSAAAPSSVLVGEATQRAASGAVAFEPAGSQVLKGKAEPVPTWRAVRVVAERGGRGRVEGIDAPFVGRDTDLRLLKELYHAGATERRIRHVSVLGTGGIGKSRLAWELEKYLDGLDEPVWWHRGRSPAYGDGITFWALGEMIRGRAGLAEGDDDETSRVRISSLVDEHMADHPDRERTEAALLQLLGIPAGVPPDELFGAWRTFFEALAATGTVVLVFEDVHWADAGTLDFVDHLVDWSRGLPIFVLTLARRELLDDRPEWGSVRRGLMSLVLEPLRAPEVRELLRGLVPRLPDRTADAIVSRAEGVPLYAIETIRMLLANGRLRSVDGALEPAGELAELADLAIPETLTALIAARLDGLPPADRGLLLDAAVLGQSFAPAGLAAVSGRAETELAPRLNGLVRRELLRPIADPRSPERGNYAFVQALIREIAYGTLAKRDRITRHLAVASWLETLADPELAAAVAGHLVAARGLMGDGPESDALAARAVSSLRAAGDRAASLAVPSQARSFYEQGAALATDPGDQAALLELAGENAMVAAEYDATDGLLVRAIDLRRSLGDRPGILRATALRARGLLNGRRYEPARSVLEDGVLEFADLDGDAGFRILRGQHSRLFFLTGNLEPAVRIAQSVVDESSAVDEPAVLGDALVTLGSSLGILGQADEGRRLLDRARDIAEANGLSSLLVRATNNSVIALMEEDPARAFELGKEGLELAKRLAQRPTVHSLGNNLCFIGLWTGEWDEADRLGMNALDDSPDPFDRGPGLGSLMVLKLFRGQPHKSELAELEAIAALHSETEGRHLRDDALGYVALIEGRFDDAVALWRPIAPSQGVAALVPMVAHADIWRGDPDAAEHILVDGASNLPNALAAGVIRRGLAAGIAGLRGDREAALLGYQELVRDLPAWRVPVHEILFAIDMAHVVGSSEPVAQAQIDLARATIERLGSPPLMRLLEHALLVGPHPTLAKSLGEGRHATPA